MCAFRSASFMSSLALATAACLSATTTGECPDSWPTSRTATPCPKIRPVRGGDLGHRDGADLGDGSDENDVGLLHERRPAHLAERRGSRQGQEDREEHRRPSVHGTLTATLCRHGRTGTLKKNGSIETATVAPEPSSSRCVAKSTRRWYTTPCGKLVESGVLFAEKTPRNRSPRVNRPL